ncbi:MAG: flagellar biosynthesis anti-sigma factor FlgM [Roseateles depolymerans]|uniref:Negative regulator of flagellin synthesis n=1 Tax=Roseateles depolymerans TaxID=76731 RepID=A0A2W5E0N9_9BURK|nr:MAG: flagellar biosynthesis anti-sigma factor FlgM [Roseateles depolymerans]
MRVTNSGTPTPLGGTGQGEAAPAPAPLSAGPALQAAALESGVLKPAQAALSEMPEIDQDKVAALRDALAKGEIRFDADRLAQLIQRYHGGHS